MVSIALTIIIIIIIIFIISIFIIIIFIIIIITIITISYLFNVEISVYKPSSSSFCCFFFSLKLHNSRFRAR